MYVRLQMQVLFLGSYMYVCKCINCTWALNKCHICNVSAAWSVKLSLGIITQDIWHET
jgi:hypothetical protein